MRKASETSPDGGERSTVIPKVGNAPEFVRRPGKNTTRTFFLADLFTVCIAEPLKGSAAACEQIRLTYTRSACNCLKERGCTPVKRSR